MSIHDLPSSDCTTALQCLRFFLETSCFEEIEFVTRLGVSRSALASIVDEWTEIEDKSSSCVGYLALNNCFNEICYGVSLSKEEWAKWFFSVSRETVCETYNRWLLSNREHK